MSWRMAANTAGASGVAGEVGGCVVLVMHTTSYNIDAFVRAADSAGLRAVIASDRCHVLDGVWQWPGDSLVIDFYEPAGAAAVIASGARALALAPVRAVIPVGGEVAALVATLASRLLGLRGNAPEAAEAAANKLRMRQLCARAAEQGAPLRVPAFTVFPYRWRSGADRDGGGPDHRLALRAQAAVAVRQPGRDAGR